MAMCIVTTIYLPALAARKLATQPAIGYVQGFIMPSAIRVPDFEYKAAAYEFYCPSWGTPIFASVLTLWSTIMSLQSIRPTHKEGCDPTTHFRPAIDAGRQIVRDRIQKQYMALVLPTRFSILEPHSIHLKYSYFLVSSPCYAHCTG